MKDIYEAVTGRIIKSLKEGVVPWHKSWLEVRNLVSDKPYQGINQLGLGESSYKSPYWLTFKQALDKGGYIRKGEQSRQVVFWKFVPCQREGFARATAKRIPFIRWSNVFNLEQTEGIEAPNLVQALQPDALQKARQIVTEARLCPIEFVRDTPAYIPTSDIIEMPHLESCISPAHYYHSLFHEMGHAVGHSSRLNRDGVARFNPAYVQQYAKEELIAELTASFLCNEAGILDQVQFERSTSYLDMWIKRLEADPKLLIQAASQAQKGADFIRGRHLALGVFQDSESDTQIQPDQDGAAFLQKAAEQPPGGRIRL